MSRYSAFVTAVAFGYAMGGIAYLAVLSGAFGKANQFVAAFVVAGIFGPAMYVHLRRRGSR